MRLFDGFPWGVGVYLLGTAILPANAEYGGIWQPEHVLADMQSTDASVGFVAWFWRE
jgi:hypothetical protein